MKTIWEELKKYTSDNNLKIKDLFNKDSKRFQNMHLQNQGLLLDFSKNKIDTKTLELLIRLAKESNLTEKTTSMFSGEKINNTEKRSVLHTALRDNKSDEILVDGENILLKIENQKKKAFDFVDDVYQGEFRGYSQKKINHIVNIGVGGSDLGSRMVITALKPYDNENVSIDFLSNVDAHRIDDIFDKINPEKTIFIISSKSFTTQETMINANTAKNWIVRHYKGDIKSIANHFIAVSVNHEEVLKFGISSKNCFEMWDWVGGRFSLWSTIGLPVIFSIGKKNFQELLSGACEMDFHFKNTKFEKNIPVILALINIYNTNILNIHSNVILPYDDRLKKFPEYLQQTCLESNGKSVQINGEKVLQNTIPVLWGSVGTNGQHAYHQLLHQGCYNISADFILVKNPHHSYSQHHTTLLANAIAQSQALMDGVKFKDAKKRLLQNNINENEADKLAKHQEVKGDKPSNTIILDKLSPFILGQLIAMFEHKTFTEGVIWNINSFDQWGVELGKNICTEILKTVESHKSINKYDSSTNGLLNYLFK